MKRARVRMNAFERQVWAAAYGTRYVTSTLENERNRIGEAFEVATYAVTALREMADEKDGPFGTGLGESSRIEADVFAEVR